MVDLEFDYHISSVQYDHIDGAMYFIALEDQVRLPKLQTPNPKPTHPSPGCFV